MGKKAKPSSLVTLREGAKLKVKTTHRFFGQKIYQTKSGYVWTGYLYQRTEEEVFASLFDAQQAIVAAMYKKNKRASTYAYRRKHCMPRLEAFRERHLWNHDGADNMRINWFNDGGKAVAVKLDSMGRPIEFLSLCDWSNKNGWELPEGDWHYFNSSVR